MGFGCDTVITKSTIYLPSECMKSERKKEDILHQHFKKIKKIGKGNFGKVFLIKSKETQKEYALKVIDVTNKEYYDPFTYKREVYNLKKVDDPNIVSFEAAFESEKKGKKLLNMITEYADNGELNQLLSQQKEYFEESQLLYWLIQCCFALKCLNENEIVHRDIKPSNIFLMKDKTIRLGDFGISKDISVFHRTQTICGTLLYMAPEILDNQRYDCTIDIYSLGVTFCHLMTLEYPFQLKEISKMKNDIIKGIKNPKILNKERTNYNEKILNNYSKDFLDLINEMMITIPSKRIKVEDILKKGIIIKRMNSLLKDYNFNLKESESRIKDYEKKEEEILKNIEKEINKLLKEGLNEKENNPIIVIEEMIDDEDDDDSDIKEYSIQTQVMTPVKEEKLKYNFLRKLSLMHNEVYKRSNTMKL